jgi:Ca-activated chloride channel homolog
MASHDQRSPEELYQLGLQQFNRADWRAAIATFTELQSYGEHYDDVDDLLADARLKLQFEGLTQPAAMAPPRRPVFLSVLAAVALLLVAGSAYGFYYLSNAAPPAVAIAPTSTVAVPTATTQPTAVPTATATPAPTPEPVVPGTVLVKTADGENFVNTPANIEIIVDMSGSMLAEIPDIGRQRWQVAQEALTTLINSGSISEQSYVVLRTYGRNRGNDCSDLEVVQGLSRFNRDGLQGLVSGLQPAVGGMTPLGASLRAAGEDLQAAEGNTAIILVTDGEESCNGDPIGEAANFVTGTDQRKVHVIGFAIDNQQSAEQLRRIAESGKGLYFDAGDSAQLAEALRQTITLSYQIQNADGEIVQSGTVGGDTVQLDPGKYLLTINANPAIEKPLEVENGSNLVVSLRQGFGGLIADVADEQ